MSDDRAESQTEPDAPLEDDSGATAEQPENSDADVLESQEEEGPADE
jgi:hypothetical protein